MKNALRLQTGFTTIQWLLLTGLGLAAAGFFGGCVSPPTSVERKFFDIETNLVARVMVVTNVVPSYVTNTVVEYKTNDVAGAGALVVPVTNATVTVSYQTNRAVATNYETEVIWTPNTNAARVSEVAGRTAGLFAPVGELVGLLVGAGFGLWGWLRSKRASKTAGVLAQIIETGRQVLQATPEGRSLDEQWKAWMIEHQAEHGVIVEVIELLQGVVDTPAAKDTAGKLIELLKRP